MDPELIKTLSTVVISAGGAAFVKEGISGILKLRQGKSAREGQRRADIIAQRDEAHQKTVDLEAKFESETTRADREAANRRLLEEHVSDLRRFCIDHGTALSALPPRPTLDLGGPHD